MACQSKKANRAYIVGKINAKYKLFKKGQTVVDLV